MKSFSNETLNFFFRKFCFSCILRLAKTVWAPPNLLQKFTTNFATKELWALENHVPANMLLCSSHFRGTLSIHWYITQLLAHLSMYVLFRRSFKTAIFSRFFSIFFQHWNIKLWCKSAIIELFIKLDVAIATYRGLAHFSFQGGATLNWGLGWLFAYRVGRLGVRVSNWIGNIFLKVLFLL